MMIVIYIVKDRSINPERRLKVSREQAVENRARVVEIAAQLFRERGFDGIGIADLMKSAGLTHGGFYAQFAGKDGLMAEACAKASADTVAGWVKAIERSGDPLTALTKTYLSTAHRDHPGQGCLMAALGPEVARQAPAVRSAVTAGFRNVIATLAGLLPGKTKAVKQERALAYFASMVGGVVLARAVDDPALSKEILHAVAASLPRSTA